MNKERESVKNLVLSAAHVKSLGFRTKRAFGKFKDENFVNLCSKHIEQVYSEVITCREVQRDFITENSFEDTINEINENDENLLEFSKLKKENISQRFINDPRKSEDTNNVLLVKDITSNYINRIKEISPDTKRRAKDYFSSSLAGAVERNEINPEFVELKAKELDISVKNIKTLSRRLQDLNFDPNKPWIELYNSLIMITEDENTFSREKIMETLLTFKNNNMELFK